MWHKAVAAKMSKNLPKAERLLRELLSLSPGHAPAHHLLGHVLYLAGRVQEALRSFCTAYELNPRSRDHICDYGLLLMETNCHDRAVELFRHANTLFPDDPDILLFLADALKICGGEAETSEALDAYSLSLQLRPAHPRALLNLGVLLESISLHDEALACMKRALALAPDDPVIIMNTGCILQAMKQLDKAEEYFTRALTLAPEYGTAAWNLSQLKLLQGDFTGGWRLFDSRFRKSDPVPRRHCTHPEWRGEDLRGKKLLVWGEQAFGDMIQFSRFIPLLEKAGAFVYLESALPQLDQLLASLESASVKIWTSTEPPTGLNYAVPLMSIPAILATTIDNIPDRVPYLYPRDERIRAMEEQFGPRQSYRGGLVWAGRKQPDPRRSIPLQSMAPLAKLAGIEWYSLQFDERRSEIGAFENKLPLVDLAGHITNFEDTAALICNLDFVVTIDTAVAHLAGALGKPTFLLLPFVPDWRWMLDRDDSPWYPTMRIFRQHKAGNWDGAVHDLTVALESFTQKASFPAFQSGRPLKCYIYREGADFFLSPRHKGQSITHVYEAAEDMQLVCEPDKADFFLFPYDLTPLQNCAGLGNSTKFLEALPFYDRHADRHVAYSTHDDPRPFPIPAIIFKASVSATSHNDRTIPAPFLVTNFAGQLTFDPGEIHYSTGFVGYPGSSPLRERLIINVAGEKRLRAFFDVAPKFHWHLSQQETAERWNGYVTFLRSTLAILCPRGDGENSFRFFETLSMGRIPVLLADTCLLPGEGVIPYDDAILRICESEVEHAGEILYDWLSSQSPEQLLERCRTARAIWEAYFSTSGFGWYMVSVMRNKLQ